MLQDALNQISGIINIFPIIYKIAIDDTSQITIYYSKNRVYDEKTFTNAIDLIEWCE